MGLARHPTEVTMAIYGVTESPNGYAGCFVGGRNYFGGNVGIGEVDPERSLHITGEGPRVLIEATAGNPEVNFKTPGDAPSDVWAIYKHVIDSDLHFYQNGDRMTIQKNTGNVGIGATDPGPYKLYVSGDAYSTGNWQCPPTPISRPACSPLRAPCQRCYSSRGSHSCGAPRNIRTGAFLWAGTTGLLPRK
jgi:hypothetical protein